ncbi:crAss001_48 related protein [Fusobacterium hominis]|uniref:crAss001_48 related protein n=1 Tax=Fusobacterium hominis TaxID=2764326 RepID=UPI0022E153FE|nr:hypothetical protein [Fusobacterium hominis]
MEHIKRMETELAELEERIQKAQYFLKKELSEPKFTDEIQRMELSCQIEYMINYARILKDRITYDTKKLNV